MTPYFEYLHIKNLQLPNINPIMGGVQQCSPMYTYGPVMRQYYILFYVMNGKGEYTVNGVTYKVEAGEGFIIRPYEVHILRADGVDPWEHLWIGFETDLALPDLLCNQYVFDAEEYAEIFSRFLDLHRNGGDSVDYSANLYTLFAHMHASEHRKNLHTDTVETAIEIIKKEFADITVQSLADRLYLNRSYFGACFKKKVGKSPKEYIDEYRLSVASKLIHEFKYSVTQAAYAVGYSDRTVFSKMYKKHYGVSPRGSVQSTKGKTIRL